MRYSPPGTASAVDAGQITVAAWRSDSVIALQFHTQATLRALAVAIHASDNARAFALIGRDPFSPLSLDLARGLLRAPGVAAALTQTLGLSDAEDLRDALTTAIDELQTKPEGDWEDQR